MSFLLSSKPAKVLYAKATKKVSPSTGKTMLSCYHFHSLLSHKNSLCRYMHIPIRYNRRNLSQP